ncbi:uncharacterized protein F5147DRAFT_699292 [Suillus discolor]|uniref:Secreted protein n=1 Tax=Suillus discolor TaxID=1912936 RepID=A0A9P7F651_9AGAM|nr:uncharacterized protein F5147DRAFT_699292 [Suillus discolor]KAG2107036.1 hypothetical protein F5147DRAFT_699292 [Suillus discolor]
MGVTRISVFAWRLFLELIAAAALITDRRTGRATSEWSRTQRRASLDRLVASSHDTYIVLYGNCSQTQDSSVD